MPASPEDTTDQPFRALFLHHLEPDVRQILEHAGFFLEAAFLETFADRTDEAYPIGLCRAVLDDLDAILFHLGNALDDWGPADAELGTETRRMMKCFDQLSDLRNTLADGLE